MEAYKRMLASLDALFYEVDESVAKHVKKIALEAYKEASETPWIKISGEESLPKDDSVLVLFVEFNSENEFIQEFIGSWSEVKTFREHELKYDYTHYTFITPPKN